MPLIADELEKRDIDIISSVFYFAGVVKNMLKEIENNDETDDFNQLKEVVIRYMLDWGILWNMMNWIEKLNN